MSKQKKSLYYFKARKFAGYSPLTLEYYHLELRRKMLTMSGSIKLCRFLTAYFFRMTRRDFLLMWWLRCMTMHHTRTSAQTQKQAEQGNQQFCFHNFQWFLQSQKKNTDIFPCKAPQLQKIKALSTLLKTQVHSTQNASTFESKRKCV